MSPPRSVLLLGASGLIGSECLRLLADSGAYNRIVVLARRPLSAELSGPKVEAHVVSFDLLTASARYFDVDQIICALGTTISQAGSRPQFRTVDLVYPLTAAHLGIERKVSHLVLVSSLGANARSPVFYNRIKGQLEDAVSALRYRSLTIVRPSVLVGKREHPRTGEGVAGALGFLFPPRFRPIKASDVARAIVHQAILDEPGRRIIESVELREIANRQTLSARSSSSVTIAKDPIAQSMV